MDFNAVAFLKIRLLFAILWPLKQTCFLYTLEKTQGQNNNSMECTLGQPNFWGDFADKLHH